jgi:hypothetical protein
MLILFTIISVFYLQGTQELREALKSPEAVPTLCQVMVSAKEPQVRQYAAVILRKRFGKSRHWNAVHYDMKTQ